MHRVWLIAGAPLIFLLSAGRAFAATEPFEDYAQNIHPRMVQYCAECHSRTSNVSRRPVVHSDRDPAHAYPIFLGLATAAQFENSRLFARIANQHYCFDWGENCDRQNEIEREVLEGTRSWLRQHSASLAAVADGAQVAAVTVPDESSAILRVSIFGPRQAWGAPEVRAWVRPVLGSTYRLDGLALIGGGGTWRVRDVRISVNGAPVFASALGSIDFRATIGSGFAARRETWSSILFERPLGSMSPGQTLTLSAKIEAVEPRESCPDLEIFETIGLPWILNQGRVALVFSGWMGTGWEPLVEWMAPNRRTRADVLSLCNRFAERLSPAIARSPFMADFQQEDRLMAGTLAQAMTNPASWLVDVLRAPKAKFEVLASSTPTIGRPMPDFTCGRTAEGDLHCWGGLFGSRRPQREWGGRVPNDWPSLDPQEAGQRRIRFPEPIESFAVSDSGLVCAIGRSSGTVRCAGHVERRYSESGDRNGFNPSPLGANYQEPREAPFWNTIPGDRPMQIAAVRDNFCVRMQSGRVFCHGPIEMLRGIGIRPAVSPTTPARPATPANRSSPCSPGYSCDLVSSIFSSLDQRPVPVPIQEPVDTLLGLSNGFCAIKGARAYCWGYARNGGLISDGDFALLENRSLQITNLPAGSLGVAGWKNPQRPNEPPQFLSGRLFAEPIKKIVSSLPGELYDSFHLLTESGRLLFGWQRRRTGGGPIEDVVNVLDVPKASDFLMLPMSRSPCVLTQDDGRISCPFQGLTPARLQGPSFAETHRVLNLREPQKQLVYMHRARTLCGLGESDGQVRCVELGSQTLAIEGDTGLSLGRLRHLMGFGLWVPDLSLLVPVFVDRSTR